MTQDRRVAQDEEDSTSTGTINSLQVFLVNQLNRSRSTDHLLVIYCRYCRFQHPIPQPHLMQTHLKTDPTVTNSDCKSPRAKLSSGITLQLSFTVCTCEMRNRSCQISSVSAGGSCCKVVLHTLRLYTCKTRIDRSTYVSYHFQTFALS